ncbi:WXG100 family type VII secretion target [Glycomyces paridis]|uniref:Outer membrane channel protein CpnT-like N-terminal domain-containing protein n=1 Tax=Glycomyces paridis TaxID=2126555 RepID=A0A4S8PHS7_9ACTN|nr:hypothetical protein [Glycomyces paridis]THV30168.1 hypothetical protein E9998_07295 [Glycomyces paridis]
MSDNPLVADVQSSHTATTGFWIYEDAKGVVDSIGSENWIDPVLAGLGAGLGAASLVMDPIGGLLSAGISWAMEYFEPLRSILDDLTGNPDVVRSHAETWGNIGDALSRAAEDIDAAAKSDLTEWVGSAAEAYAEKITYGVEAAGGLAGAAYSLQAATDAAGNLVQAVREAVRDLIADLVARVIVWAVEAIFVVTIPIIASQIAAAVVKWLGIIVGLVDALTGSLQDLITLVRG